MNPEDEVVAHAVSQPARLGATRLICIDGPSGSGKSTIARRVARITPASVVHTDDLCPGWDGIPELPGILAALLAPLANGRSGRFPRYDWILGRTVEDVVVEPAPVIVLEGVGAGAAALAAITSTLVWVDAAPTVRRTRALDRDGTLSGGWWEPWASAEGLYFAAAALPARADLTFDTSG